MNQIKVLKFGHTNKHQVFIFDFLSMTFPRFRLFSIAFVFLTACASSPSLFGPQFLLGAIPDDADNSVLTSRCNIECNELLKNTFVFETPVLFPVVGAAIINEVDGQKGSVTTKCAVCENEARDIFNDADRFGFELHVPPGEHLIRVSKNHYASTFSENLPIQFVTESAHRYFIGNITETFEGYTWSPVVVDLTDMVIVYPEDQPW